jgi:hypothetical protein
MPAEEIARIGVSVLVWCLSVCGTGREVTGRDLSTGKPGRPRMRPSWKKSDVCPQISDTSFHHGVPPRCLAYAGFIGTPYFFNCFLTSPLQNLTKKAKLET